MGWLWTNDQPLTIEELDRIEELEAALGVGIQAVWISGGTLLDALGVDVIYMTRKQKERAQNDPS